LGSKLARAVHAGVTARVTSGDVTEVMIAGPAYLWDSVHVTVWRDVIGDVGNQTVTEARVVRQQIGSSWTRMIATRPQREGESQ